MKKRIALCLVIFLMGSYGCGEKSDVASGKTLAKVNNYKITEGDLNFLTMVNPRASLYLATPANKQQVLDGLIEKELLYQSAVKEGLNKSRDVKAQINYNIRELLAKVRIDAAVEEEAKKYYDTHRDEFEQVHVAYILIRQEIRKKEEPLQIVQKIKSRLDAGEDFMKIAGEISADSSHKDRAGDLGFITRNDRALERLKLGSVLKQAFQMKKGEISNPITTDEDICLVKVIEEATLKSFDEVKNSIGFRIHEDVKKELLNTLKQKTKIEYHEK